MWFHKTYCGFADCLYAVSVFSFCNFVNSSFFIGFEKMIDDVISKPICLSRNIISCIHSFQTAETDVTLVESEAYDLLHAALDKYEGMSSLEYLQE